MRIHLIDIQMRCAEINQGQGSALMQGLFDVADHLAAGTLTGTPSPVATVERVPPTATGTGGNGPVRSRAPEPPGRVPHQARVRGRAARTPRGHRQDTVAKAQEVSTASRRRQRPTIV